MNIGKLRTLLKLPPPKEGGKPLTEEQKRKRGRIHRLPRPGTPLRRMRLAGPVPFGKGTGKGRSKQWLQHRNSPAGRLPDAGEQGGRLRA